MLNFLCKFKMLKQKEKNKRKCRESSAKKYYTGFILFKFVIIGEIVI